MRAVKSPEELKKIKAAQAITDEVFENVLGMIKEGMSEKEVASLLNSRIYSKGATLAFDTIVAFGENTSKPHAHPSDRKLKKGRPGNHRLRGKVRGLLLGYDKELFLRQASRGLRKDI